MNPEVEVKLKEFITNTEPKGKQSVLLPYSDVVLKLYQMNYTQKQISDFFLLIGIPISRESVGDFIRKHFQLLITQGAPVSNSDAGNKPIPVSNDEDGHQSDKGDLPQMRTMQTKRFSHDPTGNN